MKFQSFNSLLILAVFLILTLGVWMIPAGFSSAKLEPIVPCGTATTPPCEQCHIVVLMVRLINFGMKYLAMPLAVLMFVWAGFVYAFSGGSQDRIKAGKTILKNTVLGLLIVFLAYFAVDTAIKALSGNFQGKGFTGFIGTVGPWHSPTLKGACKEALKAEPSGGGVAGAEKKISDVIKIVANTFATILMGLSTLMILYSAWTYVTAAGDEDKLKTARRILVFALVGVAVALLAFSLPTLVSNLISGYSSTGAVGTGEGAGPGSTTEPPSGPEGSLGPEFLRSPGEL